MEYLQELQNDVLVYGYMAIIFEIMIAELAYRKRAYEIDNELNIKEKDRKNRSIKSWLSIKTAEAEFLKSKSKEAA